MMRSAIIWDIPFVLYRLFGIFCTSHFCTLYYYTIILLSYKLPYTVVFSHTPPLLYWLRCSRSVLFFYLIWLFFSYLYFVSRIPETSSSSSSSGSSSSERPPNTLIYPSTAVLAGMLKKCRQSQRRLDPFMDRYIELMEVPEVTADQDTESGG